MFTPRVFLLCGCLAMLASAPARAQDPPLARILVDFIAGSAAMAPGEGGIHEPHFFLGENTFQVPHQLHKTLVSQLSTFPTGTSSGGFTYTLDEATGAITPSSRSFGPAFAERPLTIGRRKFNAGVQYQHVEYDAYEGVDLDSEEITVILRHNNCCPPTDPNRDPQGFGDHTPPFEGDLVETQYALNVKTDTTIVFANYGVTNQLEVGAAIPLVRTNLRIAGRSSIVRLATAGNTAIHNWDGSGQTVKELSARGGSASGLGDILIRGKYAFVPGVVAAEVDFRLPTGDESELLGTGGSQTRLMLIAGVTGGSFSPHVNVGYVFGSGSFSSELTNPSTALNVPTQQDIDLSIPDEFVYTAGFDWAPTSRVTFAADVIGRTIRDVLRFAMTDSTYQFRTAAGAPLQTTTRPQFNVDPSRTTLNLLLGAAGAKVNVATNLLLTANVLFPLNDAGLRPRITPVIGFDYAF